MKEKNKIQNNKNFKSGFTLLELLVVVLIIGILAAIALPQYRKAVEKSKATQALTLLQSLYESAQVYQLATSDCPSSVDKLDIDIPLDFKGSGEWEASVVCSSGFGIRITRKQGKYAGTGFAKYREHPYNFIPIGTNLCFEQQKVNTPIFNGPMGSYCDKIFSGKAVYVSEENWGSVWALP